MVSGAISIAQALEASGLDPREARLLLAAASGFSQAGVLANPERALPDEVRERFADWSARRRAGEPVAYLLGRREFYGLALAVNPAVLIPRPETELLVEFALERLAPGQAARVLDLGTGSGAVALAIKQQRPHVTMVAVEASAAALVVARRNAASLGLAVDLRHGIWFDPVRGERFDLIVSNPPYVAEDDAHLGEGDLRFEPRSALVAGADGLQAIRAIAAEARAHLLPDGILALEHGYDQAGAVREVLAAGGLRDAATRRDLAGIERVTRAQA